MWVDIFFWVFVYISISRTSSSGTYSCIELNCSQKSKLTFITLYSVKSRSRNQDKDKNRQKVSNSPVKPVQFNNVSFWSPENSATNIVTNSLTIPLRAKVRLKFIIWTFGLMTLYRSISSYRPIIKINDEHCVTKAPFHRITKFQQVSTTQ